MSDLEDAKRDKVYAEGLSAGWNSCLKAVLAKIPNDKLSNISLDDVLDSKNTNNFMVSRRQMFDDAMAVIRANRKNIDSKNEQAEGL